MPTVQQFLAAPLERVRQTAPETLMWIVEGTRRSAALAGIEPHSDHYPRWSLWRMIECLEVIFSHGVRHVVTPLLSPSQFAEVTPRYRSSLIHWVGLLVNDREILQRFKQTGWRIRLRHGNKLPALSSIADGLAAETAEQGDHTLWILVVPEAETLWDELLAVAARSGAKTRGQLICALYGEDIPVSTMLISFGKPVVSTDQLPPLLIGKMDCYWTQQPGYRLTEHDFRTILYDAAFVRRTWQKDKTGRAEEATAHRMAWEQGPIVGLGVRLGPFWYPAPLPAVAACESEDTHE